MPLDQLQLKELLSHAQRAALDAGKIIKKANPKNVQKQEKEEMISPATRIVTEVDLRAQEVILNHLHPTKSRYQFGFLCEEGENDQSRFHCDYFWCIDPLDGTLNFSQGKAGYSTSIALVSKEGKSILGVVYDPVKDELTTAAQGLGCLKNGTPFQLGPATESETLLISQGPAVTNALKVLDSPPAIYYKLPKKERGGGSVWDFAASSIIFQEAGGYHSDYFGEPLNLNPKDTTFMNHCGIIFASDHSLISKSLIDDHQSNN